MLSEILIQEKIIKIPVDKLIFLHGKYGIDDVKKLPYTCMEWGDIFEEIFINSDKMIEFLSYSKEKINQSIPEENLMISNIWNDVYSKYVKVGDLITNYKNINENQKNSIKKSNLIQEIKHLEAIKQNVELMKDESIFQSKRDLLQKLEIELKSLDDEFEIQTDEYTVSKKKIDSFRRIQESFNTKIKKLKRSQSGLFKTTNEITKQMDDMDPQLQTYNEKLEVLDPVKKQEDFNRIQKKFNDLKSSYEKLMKERSLKMKESQNIKKQIRNLHNQNKANSKNLNSLMPNFQEIDKKYKDSNKKREIIKEKINKVRKELDSFVPNNKNIPPQVELNKGDMFYSNPSQIGNILEKKRSFLIQIDKRFENSYNTNDLSFVNNIISKEKKELLKQIDTVLKTLKNVWESVSSFQFFIDKIENVQNWMNKLINNIELQFSFSLSINKENPKNFFIEYKIVKNNQDIKINADLKRIDKTFFYLSFIISIYLSNNYKIIPIRLKSLPKFMITQKTFNKAINLLYNIRENLPKETQIIFLLEENTYDVSPLKVINID